MTTEAVSVFADPALGEEFARRGYVVAPLLSRDEVEALLKIRRDKARKLSKDFSATLLIPDAQYRRDIQEAIDAAIPTSFTALLSGYKNCSSVFIEKRARTRNGGVGIHQDLAFVDQAKYAGVNVWIPLVDVDAQNGCMNVFPGTHSLVNYVSTVPEGPSPYDSVKDLLEAECSVTVPMKAGTALLYDGRLLHSSGENRTSSERPVVGGMCIPEICKVRFYVRRSNCSSTVDVLEADSFLDVQLTREGLDIVNPSGVRRLGTEEHAVSLLKPADIDHLRIRRNGRPATAWFTKTFAR
jgi:hypothetical protein